MLPKSPLQKHIFTIRSKFKGKNTHSNTGYMLRRNVDRGTPLHIFPEIDNDLSTGKDSHESIHLSIPPAVPSPTPSSTTTNGLSNLPIWPLPVLKHFRREAKLGLCSLGKGVSRTLMMGLQATKQNWKVRRWMRWLSLSQWRILQSNQHRCRYSYSLITTWKLIHQQR